ETPTSAAVRETKRRHSGPVQLGNGNLSADKTKVKVPLESVVAALQPLQVLFGLWNATSHKALVDRPGWAWHFQTDRNKPRLSSKPETGASRRDAQWTFRPEMQAYQLTACDRSGGKRVLEGEFSEPLQDFPVDVQKLLRTFIPSLTEAEPLTAAEV